MPATPRALIVLFILAVAAAFAPARAQQGQLNRCTAPGGGIVYTDRRCDAIGLNDRVPRDAPAAASANRRTSCARTLQSLIYEITAAIDNRDVNRLGGVYHWVGHNQASGDRILDRLQAVVDRPLVDIAVLRRTTTPSSDPPAAIGAPAITSPSPPTPIPPSPDHAPVDSATPAAVSDSGSATDNAAASPVRPQPRNIVVGLKLEQTLLNSATPSRTIFALNRNLDCWWISF